MKNDSQQPTRSLHRQPSPAGMQQAKQRQRGANETRAPVGHQRGSTTTESQEKKRGSTIGETKMECKLGVERKQQTGQTPPSVSRPGKRGGCKAERGPRGRC